MKSVETICENCLNKLLANEVVINDKVFFLKNCIRLKKCEEISPQLSLISTDISYYQLCVNQADDLIVNTKNKNHPNIFNICIIEATENCNLKCSTCIANSFPGAGQDRSIKEIKNMIKSIEIYYPQPDILMLSGGEPTIHNEFKTILELAFNSRIPHVMLVTNGLLLAEDKHLVNYLSKFSSKIEVYLQFDSLIPEVLVNIRGSDLVDIRGKALENLEKNSIPTTLVCVIKKGQNDHEINDLINYALSFKCVRGITFQPIKVTGRHVSFNKSENVITLSEVRNIIINESKYFNKDSIIPHPANPVNISIGYLYRNQTTITSITKELFHEYDKNRYRLKDYMYFIPQLNDKFRYDELFRVTIVSYMDKYNFCFDYLKNSNIGIVTDDLKIVPLDLYYIFKDDIQRLYEK